MTKSNTAVRQLLLERYTELFQSAPFAYVTLNSSGRILLLNDAAGQLFGIEAGETLGNRIVSSFKAAFRGFLHRVFEESHRQSCETALTMGGEKDARIVIHALRSSGSDECQAILMDASDREAMLRIQSESTTRNKESLFASLVAHAPVGVYVVDEKFILRQINAIGLKVFKGIRPLVGRNFSQIVQAAWPAKVAGEIIRQFRKTLASGEPFQAEDFSERRRNNGRIECYEWQIQRVTLPSGEHGVVCFFNNITARKRVEESRRRIATLAASNRSLEREVKRRCAAEKRLKKSDLIQSEMLKESSRMQEDLRELSRRVLSAQEEERKRISRELHDVVAQTLTGINLRLADLKKNVTLSMEGLEKSITLAQQLVEKSVDIVHQFARELRPAVLDDLGLIPALRTFLESFMARTGIRTALVAAPEIEQLNGSKRTVFFRVAQEALTNAAKHANARRVKVILQTNNGLALMKIVDNGKGFNVIKVLQAQRGMRLGLIGMRERVEMLGGTLSINSVKGSGTTVQVRMPIGIAGRPIR